MADTTATQAAPARPFRYGWIVLGVAAFVVLLGAGTRAAPGALLLGIEADTGWGAAQVAPAPGAA